MELEDALFEDMQTLSDDAETLGLTDVALVLEFAMDVYLHEKAGAKLKTKLRACPLDNRTHPTCQNRYFC
jgi:hypothetical protein